MAASTFFSRAGTSRKDSPAIISLKRDLQVSVQLQDLGEDGNDAITNTRFGSFPHSTLLNKAWGSQIIATNVNARDAKKGKKRKRDDAAGDGDEADQQHVLPPAYEAASRGFAHLLPPTPELWTVSLPHRTQVVYTPDYSFILQKLRARPGETIIEAGAGSGSFTHAAARAVYSGHPLVSASTASSIQARTGPKRRGKVYSFEYHEPRAEQLKQEIRDHGLQDIVTVTHRDVYEKGFLLDDGTSPLTSIIFLDLPEPRRAIAHLSRSPPAGLPAALNPNAAARLCCFSPCVEQVQQTVEALQSAGWVELSTFTIDHRRVDVRRELVSLNYEGLRGVNASAANVDEALAKLRELDAKLTRFHAATSEGKDARARAKTTMASAGIETKQQRLERIKEQEKSRKAWREGRLSHRTEPDLKTHTSFLTFAVLPVE